MFDNTGKATLAATATTGQYFFFALVRSQGSSYVWNVPANLVAGDNSITLTQANVEVVP